MTNQIQLYIKQSGGYQLLDFNGSLTFNNTVFDLASPFDNNLGYSFSEKLDLNRRNVEILGYDLRLNARYSAKLFVNQVEILRGYIVIVKRTSKDCQFNFVNITVDSLNRDVNFTLDLDLTELNARPLNEIYPGDDFNDPIPSLSWLNLAEKINTQTDYRIAIADSGKRDLVYYGADNQVPVSEFDTCLTSRWGDPHIWLTRDFYLNAPASQVISALIQEYNQQTGENIEIVSLSEYFNTWISKAYLTLSDNDKKVLSKKVAGYSTPVFFYANFFNDPLNYDTPFELNPFSLFNVKRSITYDSITLSKQSNLQRYVDNPPNQDPATFAAGSPHYMLVNYTNQTDASQNLTFDMYALPFFNGVPATIIFHAQFIRYQSIDKSTVLEQLDYYTDSATVPAFTNSLTRELLPGEYVEISYCFETYSRPILSIENLLKASLSIYEAGYKPYFTGQTATSVPGNIVETYTFNLATILKELTEQTQTRLVVTPDKIYFVDSKWSRVDIDIRNEKFDEAISTDIKWLSRSINADLYEQSGANPDTPNDPYTRLDVNLVPNSNIAETETIALSDSDATFTSILDISLPPTVIRKDIDSDIIDYMFANGDMSISQATTKLLAVRDTTNTANTEQDYSEAVSVVQWIQLNLGNTVKLQGKSIELNSVNNVYLVREPDAIVPDETKYYYQLNKAYKDSGKSYSYRTNDIEHVIQYKIDTTNYTLSQFTSNKTEITVTVAQRGVSYRRVVTLGLLAPLSFNAFTALINATVTSIITTNSLLLNVFNLNEYVTLAARSLGDKIDTASFYFSIDIFNKETSAYNEIPLGAFNIGENLDFKPASPDANWPWINRYGVIKLNDYPALLITLFNDPLIVDFNRPAAVNTITGSSTACFYMRLNYPDTHDVTDARNKFLSNYQAYQVQPLTTGVWPAGKRTYPRRKRTNDTDIRIRTAEPYMLVDGNATGARSDFTDYTYQNYTQFKWIPGTTPNFNDVRPDIANNVWSQISNICRYNANRKLYIHYANQYTYYAPFIMRSLINEYTTPDTTGVPIYTNLRMKEFNQFLWENFQGKEIETWTLDISIYDWNRLRLITPIIQIKGRDYFVLDIEYNMAESSAQCKLIRRD